MDNEVYQEIYGHILNDTQRIRKEIMAEWGDMLMFGGTMPKNVVEDLSTAARITGLAFDALSNHGISYKQVPEKPDLYCLSVRKENYVCHKSAIPSMSGFLDEVNLPGVPSGQQEKTSSDETEEWEETEEEEEDADVSAKEEAEVLPSYITSEEEFSSDTSLENVSPEEEPLLEEETQNSAAEEVEEEPDKEEDLVYPQKTAEIIGGTKIASMNKKDLFIEEYRKHVDDIIYEMFEIALTHSGASGGGKPEDMLVMIAPLKIHKFAMASVPILVAVYNRGKIFIQSSYDNTKEGQNTVTMNVNQFDLLFRGIYDADGRFKGYITTTGISASQGDALNVTSEQQYGDSTGRNVNNGHIKIRSMVDAYPGTIEAFPFGDPEDNEFIIMPKNDEFVDYIYISDTQKGLKKALIDADGIRKQILCSWDGDYMNIELKEV